MLRIKMNIMWILCIIWFFCHNMYTVSVFVKKEAKDYTSNISSNYGLLINCITVHQYDLIFLFVIPVLFECKLVILMLSWHVRAGTLAPCELAFTVVVVLSTFQLTRLLLSCCIVSFVNFWLGYTIYVISCCVIGTVSLRIVLKINNTLLSLRFLV